MTEAEAKKALKGVPRAVLVQYVVWHLSRTPNKEAGRLVESMQEASLVLKQKQAYERARRLGLVKE